MKKDVELVVDGERLVIAMDVTAFVKWENRAKEAGMSVESCLSLFLSEGVQRTR